MSQSLPDWEALRKSSRAEEKRTQQELIRSLIRTIAKPTVAPHAKDLSKQVLKKLWIRSVGT